MKSRLLSRLIVAAAALLSLTGVIAASGAASAASNYPHAQVRIVVPYTAGGATDLVGRIIAQYLTQKYGQSYIVDNRLGGGGVTGAAYVSSSAPDGYTLLFATETAIITPMTVKSVDQDVRRDLTPITEATVNPFILVVNASSPIKSVADLVTYAKNNPDKFSWGLGGFATPGQFGIERFMQAAHLNSLIVPYPGEANTITAVLGGEVDAMFSSPSAARPEVQAGKMRALASATKDPLPDWPGVPTLASQGYPVEAGSWFAFWGPKNLPADVVQTVHDQIVAALADPVLQAKLKPMGVSLIPSAKPSDFASVIEQASVDDESMLKSLNLYKAQ